MISRILSKEDQFAHLIEQCGDQAYNFAYRLSGNEHDAKDLVQSAFMKALENISHYNPSQPFQPWLNRILHNLYVDSVKRYERQHVISLDMPIALEDQSWNDLISDDAEGPGDALSRMEIESVVQSALNRIEIEYRTAVILADLEGMSYEEISRIMSCPVGTVRSRIHRGRLLLKKCLAPFVERGEMLSRG